jgi:hypothetical protein
VADGGATTSGTSTVTIALKDANGNGVLNAGTPQINVSNGTPALASMAPVGALSPAGGVITVTVVSTTTPGTIQMSATAPGLAGCSAIIMSGSPGAPTHAAATFSTSPIAADAASTSTLQIDTVDANGLRAIGDNLTQINISQSSGANVCTVIGVAIGTNPISVSGSGSATVVQGRVAFTIQSTSTPGQCGFIVTPNNNTIAGTSATLTTQIVGLPNKIAVLSSDSPHAAAAGGSCNVTGFNSDRSCTRIVVGVQDANGFLRTGDNSTAITATRDGSGCTGAGGGDVSNPGTITASGGKVTFLFTSAGAYSACRIGFSSTGLSSASVIVQWTPGSPDHLACSLSPTAIGVNSGAVSVASVTVRDLLGNVATAGTYSVTFVRTSGSATTLVSQSLQYTSGGFASFSVKPGTITGTDVWAPTLSVGSLPNVAGVTPSCVVMVV